MSAEDGRYEEDYVPGQDDERVMVAPVSGPEPVAAPRVVSWRWVAAAAAGIAVLVLAGWSLTGRSGPPGAHLPGPSLTSVSATPTPGTPTAVAASTVTETAVSTTTETSTVTVRTTPAAPQAATRTVIRHAPTVTQTVTVRAAAPANPWSKP